VPTELSRVPDAPLDVQYGNLRLNANDIVDASKTLKKPRVSWKADPNALYFLLMEDQDIDGLPVKFNHWTVTNIPGNKIAAGDEVTDYVGPSPFTLTEDGKINKTLPQQGGNTHRYLFLVYKQNGRVDVPGQKGCTADVVNARVSTNHDELQAAYNLQGPVAGNYMRVGYSLSGSIEFNICQIGQCLSSLGQPNPFVIAGVTDVPVCPPCPVCNQ